MAISVATWVWDHSESRHGARLVLLAIADCMRAEGGWAWPSNKEIGRKTKLAERAVQSAITDLVKLGELEVQYNEGPKGCNRYRVLVTPAESAPPQNLHPANDAPSQDLRGASSPQANGQTPADTAPPADSAGVQISTPTPAESAPGTVKEPKVKISPTERSTPAKSGEVALFVVAGEVAEPEAKGKRGRPVSMKGADPAFAEWYAAYPVHKARGEAEPAYAKAIREGADPLMLLESAKRYRDDPQVRRGFGKYPATWLNKKCWLDEDAPEPQQEVPAVSRREQERQEHARRALERAAIREANS